MLYYSDFYRFKEDVIFILKDVLDDKKNVCYEKEAADTYINYIQNLLNALKKRNT